MNRDAAFRHGFRILAIAIAVAAVIDPVMTLHRSSKPEIAIVASSRTGDKPLAAQVKRALGSDFTVLPASFERAAATVLVGNAVPYGNSNGSELAQPVFAVITDTTTPGVTIEHVSVPATVPLEARTPIVVTLRGTSAGGRNVALSLKARGVVVDHIVRRVPAGDERLAASLSYLPTAVGATPLRVVATLGGAHDSTEADVVADVRDTRWPILFFDPHPSWMSTFVRRAVERDRRFLVSSRVVTSRNVSVDAGEPPSRLEDLAGVSRFAVIVVGAPDGLTESDVSGLEAFLRRRGGRVILLLDAPRAGPIRRLTGAVTWVARAENPSVDITSSADDSLRLRASEIAWPATLPSGADALARVQGESNSRVAIWRAAVGAGAVTVSGALDAWRYRDQASSSFDPFWRTLLASEASAAPPPLSVHTSRPAVTPGEVTEVDLTVRDAALRGDQLLDSAGVSVGSSVSASLEANGDRTGIRLWPGDGIGELRGTVRAPDRPGIYRVTASSDGVDAETPLVVANDVSLATPANKDLLHAWLASRGGQTIPASRLSELPGLLRAAIRPALRREIWHPMRSIWWLLPFGLALSAEWWMRRRRGLA